MRQIFNVKMYFIDAMKLKFKPQHLKDLSFSRRVHRSRYPCTTGENRAGSNFGAGDGQRSEHVKGLRHRERSSSAHHDTWIACTRLKPAATGFFEV